MSLCVHLVLNLFVDQVYVRNALPHSRRDRLQRRIECQRNVCCGSIKPTGERCCESYEDHDSRALHLQGKSNIYAQKAWLTRWLMGGGRRGGGSFDLFVGLLFAVRGRAVRSAGRVLTTPSSFAHDKRALVSVVGAWSGCEGSRSSHHHQQTQPKQAVHYFIIGV
jgi:hypothetical protein